MSTMFDNYDNIPANYTPDNRVIFCEKDKTDEIVIGGTSVHIFTLNFKVSEYCRPANWFQIIYKQGYNIITTFDIQSINVKVIEESGCDKTTLVVTLTPSTTSIFKLHRDTFAQVKLFMKDGSVIFSDINKIRMIDTLENCEESEGEETYAEATIDDLIKLL